MESLQGAKRALSVAHGVLQAVMESTLRSHIVWE